MTLTKKSRTVIFWCSLVSFSVLSFILILYANGLRIDFKNKKIIQTGGIYLKVKPEDASVYLNGKFKGKETDSILRRTFFDKLFPKKYAIRVEKKGYFPWQKNLEVRPGMVSSASHIILLPSDLSGYEKKIPFQEKPKEIWLINEKYFLELREGTSTFSFVLSSPSNGKRFKILKTEKGKGIKSFQIQTNKDSSLILASCLLKKNNGSKYYLADISRIGNNEVKTYLLPQALPKKENSALKKIILLQDSKRLIISYTKATYLFDYSSWEETAIASKEIKQAISNNGSYFLLGSSSLFQANSSLKRLNLVIASAPPTSTSSLPAGTSENRKLSSSRLETTTELGSKSPKPAIFPIESIKRIVPLKGSNLLALVGKDRIHFFDIGKKEVVNLAMREKPKKARSIECREIKDLALSPDKKKLAVLDKKGIEIIYLSNYFLDYVHKAGEKDLIAKGNYQKLLWLPDSMHLFALKKGEECLEFIEADPRDNINIFTYKHIKNFFYSPKRNRLYIEEKNGFFEIGLDKII